VVRPCGQVIAMSVCPQRYVHYIM